MIRNPGQLPGVLLLLAFACANRDTPPPQQPAAQPQGYPAPGYAGTYPNNPPPNYPNPGYPPAQAPGYPPAQAPAYPPAQPAYPPPTAAPAPAPQAPPPGSVLPPPAFGSFDVNGGITLDYMRREPASVIAELVAALSPGDRAKVQGIPLQVIDDAKEVNAFAACGSTGGAFMGVTSPLLLIMARTSETRAFDETYGTSKYNELANGFAQEVKAQKSVVGPGPGFLPLPQALDPRKLSRQSFLFDEQVAFVLGHELAHHYRGHTGCANGAASANSITLQDLGRLASSAVPVFNQPNEYQADVEGTFNLLDTGSRRQAGKWTEEGALMILDFFSRLQSLGVETLLLGFLSTHPPPQWRIPAVQNSAQQWRNAGGKAPLLPFRF